MGSKKRGNGDMLFRDSTGKQTQISVDAYQSAVAEGNKIAGSDISSLDRQELTKRLNDGLSNNTNPNGNWDSSMSVTSGVNAELADAVAGTKPKYRYRKYLDSVSQMQSDQPGQLQTMLSRGTNGSTALGGG